MTRGYPDFSLHIRPFWYDRNPVHKHLSFHETHTPHATVARWSYTVPTDKKAFIEAVICHVGRATAGTDDKEAAAFITLEKAGSGTEKTLAYASIIDRNIGALDRCILGQSITLLEGDVIRGKTGDVSPDGSVIHLVTAKITEFDK